MNRIRACIIIKKKEKILLIHRIKKGIEYFVLPGGSVENSESIEAAAVRESKEETGLDVILDKKLWQHHNDYDGRDFYYFLVTKYSGKLQLGKPEIDRISESNKYFLEWHYISKLNKLKIFPEETKIIINTYLQNNR